MMSTKKELISFLIPKKYQAEDNATQITVGIINLILPISVVLGLLFVIIQRDTLFDGHKQIGLVYLDVAYIISLGLLYIFFITTLKLKLFKALYCYSGIIYLLTNFYLAADGEIATLWAFVFTILVFLLNDFKTGTIIFILFICSIFTIGFLRYEEINLVFYSKKFLDMFFFSFLLFSIVLFGNEYLRSKLISNLENSKTALKNKNKELSITVEELQKAHNQLNNKDKSAKKASQTLRTTINNTKDLIWVINATGEFEVFNKSFSDQVEKSFNITEIPKDLLYTLEKLNTQGETLVEVWRNRYNDIFESAERTTYFDKFVSDNQTQYFLTDCQPIIENGKIIGVSNFSKDITQIRLIKKEKDELIQLNSSIIESLGEIIFNYDLRNDLFTWNEATFKVLGCTSDEMGKSMTEFLEHFSEKEQSRIKNEIEQAIETGINLIIETQFVKKNNQPHWIQITGNITYGRSGEATRIIGIVADTTDKKANEAKKLQAVVNGIDEERKRIAGEIHDGLGQTLIAASLTLNSLNEKIKKSLPKEEFSRFTHIEQMINDAIQEGRELSHNLMPKSLEDYGIIPSLRALINKINQTGTLKVEFYTNIELENRYANEIEVCLYRIAQEAFNNILKHSAANTVTIQLLHYDQELSLTIEDNGIGFEGQLDGGIGIQNIRNRVATIGGTVIIDSHQEYGTLITVEISLKNPTLS